MPELRTSAYYTYTLLLNASGWAWEFLRRNLLYRHAWALEWKAERRALARPSGVRPRAPRDRASPWGLRFLEPPHLTALEVVPFWRTDAIPVPARAGIVAGAAPASELFDLFAEPGDKAVCLTPEGALAVIRSAERPSGCGSPTRPNCATGCRSRCAWPKRRPTRASATRRCASSIAGRWRRRRRAATCRATSSG